MHDLIIIGSGGFGHELHGWLWDAFAPEEYRFKGFLSRIDDDPPPPAKWLADPLEYAPAAEDRLLLAVGDMEARQRITDVLLDKGAQFVSFIHPRAIIAANAEIGIGAVIYPFATVSHNAVLGDFASLSLYASVGHDARVGSNCYLSPYATLGGESRIGSGVFLGSHATIGPRVHVGPRSKVCANTCVLRSVPEDSFVVGVPGQRVSQITIEPTPRDAT